MARTNTRTQMIAGLLLNDLSCLLGNIEDICPGTVSDREWDVLRNDEDYMKAISIVQNMLQREMTKNHARLEGAKSEDLAEIDDLCTTTPGGF